MSRHEAMIYEDYIKLRDAKIGDTVILNDGTNITKTELTESESPVVNVTYQHPSKWRNLDSYDGTYI